MHENDSVKVAPRFVLKVLKITHNHTVKRQDVSPAFVFILPASCQGAHDVSYTLQPVVLEPVLGQLLVLGAWTPVVGIGVDGDAATWGEDAGDLNVLGIHEADEVLHDDVDAVLVEVAVVTETEEVELEALALHHALIGEIADAYLGKVGLAGDGAEAGELGAVELHPVVVLRMFVRKGLQYFWSVVGLVFGLAS